MHRSNETPSIVPNEDDQTVYLVADDFKTGRVWRETEYDNTDLETVVQDLLSGQLTAQAVSSPLTPLRDGNVRRCGYELRRRCDLQGRDIPFFLQDFTAIAISNCPCLCPRPMSEIHPLPDLELDTAIRLRWVLRDIHSQRTKLMPPSDDDLALLEQRGLITLNDGEPMLTDAANSVLDRNGGIGISDE